MKAFILLLIVQILCTSHALAIPPPFDQCFNNLPKEMWPVNQYASTPYPSPPIPFNGTLPWITITAQEGAVGESTVIIESLELWEKNNEVSTLLLDETICELCENKVWGFRIPVTDWRDDGAWCFVSEGGNCSGVDINSYLIVKNDKIEVTVEPGYVYHLWNVTDRGEGSIPRWHYPVDNNAEYFAKSKVSIGREAILNLGLDYWIEPTLSENCVFIEEYERETCVIQAAQTYWGCPSTNWQELSTQPVINKPEISVNGGFVKLDVLQSTAPDNADCSHEIHYGRMVFGSTNSILYICGMQGWKNFTPSN